MADVDGRQDTDPDNCEETAQSLAGAVGPFPLWTGGNHVVALSVSRSLYSRKAVLAAAYKHSSRCAILPDADGDERWVLYLIGESRSILDEVLPDLLKELADQALREQLEEEFGQIRTLLVAQAFSEGNLLDGTNPESDNVGGARNSEPDR